MINKDIREIIGKQKIDSFIKMGSNSWKGVFDKILDSYSTNWATESVKTKDFGALFEISYKIHLKEGVSQKNLIDELRCKNGNLTIALISAGLEEKVYL